MSRPKLLDLFCCQGGASRGYFDAGFDVVGVDNKPQPRYPFEFHQADALEFLAEYGHEFDAIHASPPCQLYSLTHRINKSDFPDLIAPTRDLLEALGLPYVIENVMEAAPELNDPVMLCGAMFDIRTYRHRLFESNISIVVPDHPRHVARTTKMGRRPVDGEYMHIVGNFSGVEQGREVMGMSWANRDGLREAIPPVYSEYIGAQLAEHIRPRRRGTAPLGAPVRSTPRPGAHPGRVPPRPPCPPAGRFGLGIRRDKVQDGRQATFSLIRWRGDRDRREWPRLVHGQVWPWEPTY